MLFVFNKWANVQFIMDKLFSKLDNLKRKWKVVKKTQWVTLPQHEFGLINVTKYGVKKPKS